MMAPSFPLLVVQRLQQHHPTGMQALYKLQRPLDRSRDVMQLRPCHFIIGFDRRPVFGQRKLGADDGVHMTVCDVMDHLPQRPPALAIRRAQLRKTQSIHRIPQLLRKVGQRCNRLNAISVRDGRRRRKAANRGPRVHIVQGHTRLHTPLLCNVAHRLCNLYLDSCADLETFLCDSWRFSYPFSLFWPPPAVHSKPHQQPPTARLQERRRIQSASTATTIPATTPCPHCDVTSRLPATGSPTRPASTRTVGGANETLSCATTSASLFWQTADLTLR